MDNLRTLYDILQRDGYDVPQEYEKFSGKLAEDKKSRESLYAVLKNDNYDVPDDYGHFSMILFGAGEKEKVPDAETMPLNGKQHQMKGGFGAGATGVPFTPDITFGKSKPGLTSGVRYKPTDNPLAFKPKSFSERNLELIPDQLYNSADIEKAVAAVFENEKSKAEKQAEAAQENFNNGAAFVPPLATGITRGAIDAENTDPESIIGKVYDKLRPRLTALIESRVNAPSPSGTKPEQAVREQVEKEVQGHIRSLIAGKYIAEKTPVNASEYILGSAAKDNVLSMLGSAIVRKAGGSSGAAERLEDEAYGRYGEKAGMLERIGAGVATLVADAPAFAFTGGLGSAAGRGMVQFAGKPLASNGLTSFAGKVASEAGKRSFTSSLSGRIITGAVNSGVTLGGYDAVSETARQMRYGEYNFGDIARATGKGAAIGALVAPIGITGRYITHASGRAVKASADVGALGLESTVFAMPGVLNKIAGGEHVGLDEMGEEFGVSIATLGMLKLKNAGRLRKEIRSRYYSTEAGSMKLTGLDKEILDSRGYGVGDLFKTEKLDNTEYRTVTERGVKASKPETASGKVLADTEILAGYENAMRDPGVPLSVKVKLAYLIEGRIVTNVPVVYGSTIEERDGRHFVTSMNAEGRPIETKEYRTKGKASRAFEKLQDISQRNSIEATENICDRYAQKTALYKACAESGDPGSLFAEYMGISRKEEKQRTPEEQNLYADITAKADKYFDRQAVSGEIKSHVGNSTGIDIDKAVVTPVKQRTESQQSAIDRYIDELRSKFLRPQKHEDNEVRLDARLTGGKDVTIVSGRPGENADGNVSDPHERVYVTDSSGKVSVVEAKELASVTETPQATVEDVIKLYNLDRDHTEFARDFPGYYNEQLLQLNNELSQALSYSKGVSTKPETYEYWKEKFNLPDPADIREQNNRLTQHPAQIQTAEFMSSLPRRKEGNMDFENFTPAQIFEYTRQTAGEETAVSDAQYQISDIDKQIKELETGLSKAVGGKRIALRENLNNLKVLRSEIESVLPKEHNAETEFPLNVPLTQEPAENKPGDIENKSGEFLEKEEKILNLQNHGRDRRTEISQSIPQGEHGTETSENGRVEEITAELRRRVEKAAGNAQTDSRALSRRELEERVAESYAKEKGVWIPMENIFDLGNPITGGNENDCYLSTETNEVYKMNNLMNSNGIIALFERNAIYNKLFKESQYTFVGFTGFDGRSIYPVFKQNYVREATFATPEEISSYMEFLGFTPKGDFTYSNGTYEVSDLRPRNVLKDIDGDIYVIDADCKYISEKEDIPDKNIVSAETESGNIPVMESPENMAGNIKNYRSGISEKEEKILNLPQDKKETNENSYQEGLHSQRRENHGGNGTSVLRGDDTGIHGNGEREPGQSNRGDGRIRLRGNHEYDGSGIESDQSGSYSSSLRIDNVSLDSLLDTNGITHTSQRVLQSTPESFYAAISSQHLDNPDGWMVSVHDIDYYKSAKLFLTEDKKSGIAISPDGDIVSLFSSVTGDLRMEKLMLIALENGGCKLDCFDQSVLYQNAKGLPDLYSRYGFEAVSAVPFDKEFAPDGWNGQEYLPIIFMVHNGKSIEDVARSYDRKSRADRTGLKEFEDYNEAMNYRDSVLKSPNRYALKPEQEKSESNSDIRLRDNKVKTLSYEKNIEKHLTELEGKFGVTVERVNIYGIINTTIKERAERGAKAWYDVNTGKVNIITDNIINAEDAAISYIHEVVAHKGLRDMLGAERHSELMQSVYEGMDAAARIKYDSRYKNPHIAADEYIADLCEKIYDGSNTLSVKLRRAWNRIVGIFRNFFRKLFNLKINDTDIEYLLWQSSQRLRNNNGSIIYHAQKSVLKQEAESARNYRGNLSEKEIIERDNTRFNEELQQQIDDTLPKDHVYKLGYPGEILKNAGIPEFPIELKASTLLLKSSRNYKSNHPYDLSDVGNLVEAIQSPVAVFESEDLNGKKVVLTELKDKRGKNFIAIIGLKSKKGRSIITVNDIISLYPKDSIKHIAEWFDSTNKQGLNMNEDLLLWVDTKKASQWLSNYSSLVNRVGLSSRRITNKIKKFESSKSEDNNLMFRGYDDNQGNTITDNDNILTVNNSNKDFRDDEKLAIQSESIGNGTYLKAPNGESTLLTPEQWLKVRTKGFKNWFGDWEKRSRIEKLRRSEPIEIIGEEYKGKYELNRDSAKGWIKENLRGEYVNKDTGDIIEIRKDGVQKVTSHSMGNEAHLKSIAIIPELIEKSIFIDEITNEKDNGKYDSYRYYVCGLKIKGVNYTVKVTVGVKGVTKYYDHSLTKFEKGDLVNNIDALSPTFDIKESPLSNIKDSKLLSILQTNFSKALDKNGEPLASDVDEFNRGEILYRKSENKKGQKSRSIELRLTKLEREFGIPVERTNISGIEDTAIKGRAERGAKAWYDTNTGKVSIITGNIINAEDAAISYIHEVVAHKGLRDMLGAERHSELMQSVYEGMDAAARIKYDSRYTDPHIAADEYIADLCEKIYDGSNTLSVKLRRAWNRIVGIFRKLFNLKINDTDIEYLLWQSSQRLRNNNDSIIYHAQKSVLKQEAESARNYRGNLSEKEIIERDNTRFNEELRQQIDGSLPKWHLYKLGYPGEVLKSAGVSDLPIELSPALLESKSYTDYINNHPFDLSEVKNLVDAIQNPIAVFDSKTRTGAKIILTELKHNGINFVVALIMNVHPKGFRRNIEVNDIRSLYSKNYVRDIVDWINCGDLLRYADKTKVLNWLTQQRSNSADVESPIKNLDVATKIIERFDNPKSDNNNLRFRGYGDNQENNIINNNENKLSVTTGDNGYTGNEKLIIESKSLGDGNYLKAPNGESTLLTPEQWLLVRTREFKNWFGDWEKPSRIEKLRRSKPIEITGKEIEPSEDLKQYKKNALEYGKNLIGEYVNRDTGEKIFLGKNGIKEILHHDYKNQEQLQSIVAIPQIIENSIYVDSEPNSDVKVDAEKFDYYFSGLKINNIDYTVRSVFVTLKDGRRYYDHKLTQIEKGNLIDLLFGTTPGFNQINPLSFVKDIKLRSILQSDFSKALDVNDEPLSSDVDEFNSQRFLYFRDNKKSIIYHAQNSVLKQETESARNYRGNLSEKEIIERDNARFNEELQRQIDGTLPIDHVYKLGYPGGILRNAGIPEFPVYLVASTLSIKSSKDYKSNHPFDLSEVRNLVEAIQYPIAVFESEELNGKKVVLTELKDKRGKDFVAVIGVSGINGRSYLEIKKVISLYPKDSVRHIAEWFDSTNKQGLNMDVDLLLWADTKKASQWLSTHSSHVNVSGLSSRRIANKIKRFESSKPEDNNLMFRGYGDNQENSITGNKDILPANNSDNHYSDNEKLIIQSESIGNDTYLKAPNGNSTLLTPEQWLLARTKEFKNWFGDWEKLSRIEKLRKSKPIEITGKEIEPSEDLKQYKKNALEYGKNLRGEYVNRDTGEKIFLTGGNKRGGIREILQYDYKNPEHLQSIAAIPDIIEDSIFITELPNDDIGRYQGVKTFRYYVCGLRINDVEYTVKAVVALQNNGNRYYDHSLTQIEKGELLSKNPTIQKAGIDSDSPIYEIKDKRLLSILQTGVSKALDVNGEPLSSDVDEFNSYNLLYRNAENKGSTNEKNIESRLTELEREFRVPVERVVISEINNPVIKERALRGAKAWYDTNTGKVSIITDNIINAGDAAISYIHEVIAHKGLRDMLGAERHSELMQAVYESMNPALRKAYTRKYVNPDMSAGEYIADLCEKIYDNSNNTLSGNLGRAWNRIVGIFRNFFRKLFKLKINDTDIEYLLWQSSQYLRGNKKNIVYRAQNSVLKHEVENARNYRGNLNEKKIIERDNTRFNNELRLQMDGKLPKGYIYKLGYPGENLKSAGVPDLPVELSSSLLSSKSNINYVSNHPFGLPEVKNLVNVIQNPIAVFDSKTHISSKVILTELKQNGANFVVALQVNTNARGYGRNLTINSIRSVYPKDNVQDIIEWINRDDLLRYADKTKVLNWLTQQRSNSADVESPIKNLDVATKIIERFENPKSDNNNLRFRGYGDNQENNIINNNENKLPVTAGDNGYTGNEKLIIESKLGGDGNYLKAPNGESTLLTPEQWLLVRTREFKNWFGDWEKPSRIEKLRRSKPIEITGKEIEPSEDLKQYKKNALEYGKNLRDKYVNEGTGIEIEVNGNSIKEVLHHDYKNVEHLQSVAAIPGLIEKGIYIISEKNTGEKDIDSFDYYVSGLRIGGVDYTVKYVISNKNDGRRYYDHKLTKIEKEKLLDLSAISSAESASTSPFSDIKDKRLLSILQPDFSKALDVNGEPLFSDVDEFNSYNLLYRNAENKGSTNEKNIESRLTELEREFRVPVELVVISEINNPVIKGRALRGAKAWYDTNTGKVSIITDNIINAGDAAISYIHEVIAHKGLRDMLGAERHSELMQRVYESMDPAVRDAYIRKYVNPDMSAGEYIADLCEKIYDNSNNTLSGNLGRAWNRIVGIFRNFFSKLFKLKINDTDIEYMLWQSSQHLKGNKRSVIYHAQNSALKQEVESARNYRGNLSEKGIIERDNTRFNEELQQQIDGTLPKWHVYKLGYPGEVLKSAGIPDLPIELSSSLLNTKSNTVYVSNLPYDLSEVKDLINYIQNPIAVLNCKTRAGSKVILTELKHNDVNFVVALQVNANARGFRRSIEINDIRSVYPKDYIQDIVDWINRGDLLRYVDKTKALNWLTQQRSNSAEVESPIKNLDVATKIIERFENPKSDNNNLRFRGYGDNQDNNIINNNENELSVTAGDNGYSGNEKLIIQSKSIGNGTYLKAPNGESTLLTPEQWRIVRTREFKNWFGDWEKPSRIEKLRRSKPIELTGKEIEPSEDLKQYKKNALEYGKNLRGEYVNRDTGENVSISKRGIKEVLNHDFNDPVQLQSVAAIPGIIENSIYVETVENEDLLKNIDVKEYYYYVCGLKINGTDYTVKSVIAVQGNGHRYYDHALTRIEKGNLIDSLSGISTPGFNQKDSLLSSIKDKRLLSILQTGFSKVLDVNGEPLSSDVDEFNSQSSRYLRDNKKSIIYHAQNPVLKHDAETASDYDGTLTEKTIIERYNARFNEELQQQIDGTLPIGHVYKLGYPSEVLKRAGIPDLPVEFSAGRLLYTSGQDIHMFDLPKMKDLPLFIQNPLAVFRDVSHAGSFVIAIESKHRGKNFVVAIEANEQKGKLKINYIRGTHYRTSNDHIANWINEGLLEYADKKKMLEWLSKQQYNSAEVRNTFKHATNIINNFENPESDDNNLIFRGYVDNQENSIINNNENKLSVTAGNNGYTGNEKLIIDSKLRGDGTYLKAPNGESTLLTPEQWGIVRSKGFKDWFGDWEKQSRIEKLRKSKPIEITGYEYKGKYELNRKSAKKWIKENLRSKYVNKDTGDSIELNRKGADKVTAHGMSNDAHLKSIAVIPELIGESVFLAEVPNEKNNGKYENYRYYVCGLKIGEIDHTVKLTVGEKGGKKYYDHSLTEIEKGKLIDITSPNGFKTKGDKSSLSSTSIKDTKLLSILQTNFSKPLDVNGEPMPEAIAEYNDIVPDILYRIKEVGEGKYIDMHKRNTTAVYKAISAYIKEHPGEFTDYSESSSSGTTSKYIKFRYHDVSYNVRFSNHTKTGNETGAVSDPVRGITVNLSQEDASITKVKMDLSHIRLNSTQIKEVLSEVARYNAEEANRFNISDAKVSVINNYRDGKPYVPYSIDISEYPYIGTAIEKYFKTDMPAVTDTARLEELRRKERRLMKKMHGIYAVGNYEVKVSWRGEIQSAAYAGSGQSGPGHMEKAEGQTAARKAENYVAGLIAPLKDEYLQVLSSIKSESAVRAVYAKAVRLPFYRTISNATPEKYNGETGLSEIFSGLEQLEREFGVPVEHVGIHTISDPVIKKQALRGAKAWYDVATGAVFIITDNIADSGDAMISYIHEVIAHKGLRDMLGAERHSELMHSVYESMDAATRVKYDSRYTNPHIAADEYIADLCEKMYNGSNTYSVKLRRAWNRIVGILRNFFRKLFNLKINYADIEYLLWQSVQHLRNNKGGIIYHAQNSILKHEAETARNYRGNLTEKELIEKDNTRFNEELQQQIDGTLSKGHIYKLGYPGDVLKSAGISDLPIEVAASTLSLKSSSDYKSNHPFDLSEIRNLVEAIQYPIAVFESEELNGKKVVLTELKDKRGKDFVAVIGVSGINGRSYIDINKVISLYPKDSVNHIAKWFDSTNKQGLNMNEDLLLWADTKKASQWLSTHSSYVNASGLSSRRITNKIKRFENPKSDDNNLMFRGYGDNRHIPSFCFRCRIL